MRLTAIESRPEVLNVAELMPLELTASRWRTEAALYAVVFAGLVGWAMLFPFTADGDSILHYLNARDGAVHPPDCLHAWARPGFKALLIPFAVHGIVPARVMMAALATAVVWQTVRLADDLRLPRALWAGPLVLWQPMAFAVAADTMTEFPMALGLVVAVRLWLARRFALSCLVLGFLPSVRPEGFFFGVMWGLMVTLGPTVGSWPKRVGLLASLTVGMATWVLACWTLQGDPLLVYHVWNWPPNSYASYGRGSLFHYVGLWPMYAGVPLTLLFLTGIRPSLRRSTWLPWTVWATVITVHSVLYWRGSFASCGLMRILSCTAPFTAVICLYGLNRAADWLTEHSWDAARRRAAGVAFAAVATAWTLGQYCTVSEHFDCFPLLRCTAYIRDHHLLGPGTAFFAGNKIAIAALDLRAKRPGLMDTPCDPDQIERNLAALPIGAVGVWDNRQAPIWHGQTIDSLRGNGFTLLFDTTTRTPVGGRDLRYVVLRKDGPFVPKAK